MNANLPQKTLVISSWIDRATGLLVAAGIASGRLDAEIILAHTLRKSRTFLHAHDDEILQPREQEIADARLQLRLDRTPIAYIIGHKEFYGRLFKVTPATLIPRPESETIISVLKTSVGNRRQLFPEKLRLVDIGTGSGVLGITAKLEFPEFDVTLLDLSNYALKVAEYNAQKLGADVTILQSDLLLEYPFSPTIIIANLPYVDIEWERSPETNHEPALALFAKDGGLSLITALISQAALRLQPGGTLLLEADPRQHETIITQAKESGFSKQVVTGFVLSFVKD